MNEELEVGKRMWVSITDSDQQVQRTWGMCELDMLDDHQEGLCDLEE